LSRGAIGWGRRETNNRMYKRSGRDVLQTTRFGGRAIYVFSQMGSLSLESRTGIQFPHFATGGGEKGGGTSEKGDPKKLEQSHFYGTKELNAKGKNTGQKNGKVQRESNKSPGIDPPRKPPFQPKTKRAVSTVFVGGRFLRWLN